MAMVGGGEAPPEPGDQLRVSEGSRGHKIFFGALSASGTKPRNSFAGILACLSLCFVASTGVGIGVLSHRFLAAKKRKWRKKGEE